MVVYMWWTGSYTLVCKETQQWKEQEDTRFASPYLPPTLLPLKTTPFQTFPNILLNQKSKKLVINALKVKKLHT